ncbi:hypothetical protein [Paraburkholderia caledonica]|uniref:Uncharacterized protein n=1 Tax=Paraburkholderia caledonica TaxID=134536 RepID=A0ABU1L415_9BURK|nr:hypothetical protein [Paraburkholderia caledonica]MDR6377950.1 hypothetical protein [Paraburkholderia caledonica]
MKKQIFGAAVAAVLTVAAMAAYAEDSLPAPPTFHHGEAPHNDGAREPHDAMGPMGPMPPIGPGFAVINDLEQLRRLYALSGRPGDIVAVYHDVLNRTQDPMLRHYVYDSLAREQLKPANPDRAIATLRTSLSEDLAAASKPPRMPFENAPQTKPQQPSQ